MEQTQEDKHRNGQKNKEEDEDRGLAQVACVTPCPALLLPEIWHGLPAVLSLLHRNLFKASSPICVRI